MSDRSGLLTLAACLAATLLIVVVAFLGIFRYGAAPRVQALGPVPSDLSLDLVVTSRQTPAASSVPTASRNALDQQRIQLLEALLADKTQLIGKQARQITRQTGELEELRDHYEDAVMLATDSLQSQGVQEMEDLAPRSPAEIAARTAAANTLEAELMLAQEIHDALVSDVESLRNQLDSAYQQLGQLREDADLAAANQLRETLALEAGTAGVLLQIGPDAVPALVQALNHADPVVRRWAATVLGAMGSDGYDAAGALAEALSDRDAGVRRAVKAALDAVER